MSQRPAVRHSRGVLSTPLGTLFTIAPLLVTLSGCGGAHPPAPASTNCAGLHCATLFKKLDVSCPQNSGRNNRTYASATQANLTVNFFYLLNQYDGQGNRSTFQNSAVLATTNEVPLACDYDVKGGTQYQYDIQKECATTRSGATLADCTTQESNLRFDFTTTTDALAVNTATTHFNAHTLLSAPSSCVDICKLGSKACLSVPFTKSQTSDLDTATGLLFGTASKNDLKGCKQTIEVKPDAANASDRAVTITGTAKACIVDINSQVGKIQIFIPHGADLQTAGTAQKFAMVPATDETPVIMLPNDYWQKLYGGRVLATEGAQAATVLTTENGCMRLERWH